MRHTTRRARASWAATVTALLITVALVAAGCGSDEGGGLPGAGGGGGGGGGGKARVRVQLSWIPDGQFAGYLVAKQQGFYDAENLDVQLLPGGPNVNAVQQVVTGAADMTINKVSALFAARDKHLPLKAIAQFDQVSSFPLVAYKSSGIRRPEDFRGKKVGIWYDGDEYEFLALMAKAGLDPKKDVKVFEQGFTMDSFLNHEYDVAMVTKFNELNVLHLSGVGEDELNVIDPSDYGVTIPHGALIANETWLGKDGNHDVAARFVRATLKGWDYAFEHGDEAAKVAQESALAAGGESAVKDLLELQKRQIATIRDLHFPKGFAKQSHGRIDLAMYDSIAGIVREFGLVKQPVDVPASFDASVWQTATGGK